MKRKLIVLSLVCLSHAYAIINGESCSEEQFPASLVLIEHRGERHGPICGATLIAPDVALTAAHCVEDYFNKPGQNGTQFYVSSRTDARQLPMKDFEPGAEKTIRVHAVLAHTGYLKNSPHRIQDDVALLFLARESTIPPAKLLRPSHSSALRAGQRSYIVGWGQNCIGAKGICHTPPSKMWAETFVNQLHETEVQFGSNSNSPRTCFGDSGGAAYIAFQSFSHPASVHIRLAGITSHSAYNDPECRNGGIDARVDAYFNWIMNSMRDGCAKGYRLFCV